MANNLENKAPSNPRKLKVAIQMNDISSIKFELDSSLLLGLEAQKRGYDLYYYQPEQLFMQDSKVMAYINEIHLDKNPDNYFKLGPSFKEDLSSMDVILVRQDPPFDMGYMTSCYMLENIKGKTLIVNNPESIRDLPEKLFICSFPEITPPTLVTQDVRSIREFQELHRDIVAKPLYAFGGRDVFMIKYEDVNFEVIINSLINSYKCPIIIQKFMPEVSKGEKRIFLVDGIAVAAVKKIPEKKQIRSNLSAGSTIEPYKLREQDHQICNIVGQKLKDRGIIFAGIDMIDNYITEINITSPTLIWAVNKMDNICLESIIWDKIEEKIS